MPGTLVHHPQPRTVPEPWIAAERTEAISLAAAGAAGGSNTVKQVPWPGALVTAMAPLLAALCLTAIPENLGYSQVRNLWLMAGYFGAPAVKKRKQARAVGKG